MPEIIPVRAHHLEAMKNTLRMPREHLAVLLMTSGDILSTADPFIDVLKAKLEELAATGSKILVVEGSSDVICDPRICTSRMRGRKAMCPDYSGVPSSDNDTWSQTVYRLPFRIIGDRMAADRQGLSIGRTYTMPEIRTIMGF